MKKVIRVWAVMIMYLLLLMVMDVTASENNKGAGMNLLRSERKMGVFISLENIRHAYLRGEEVPLRVEVTNNSTEAIDNAQLSIDIAGIIGQRVDINKIEEGAQIERLFRINSLSLKTGEYKVTCELKQGKNVISKEQFTIWIARQWNPERMRIWMWPTTHFVESLWKWDDTSRERFNWGQDKGWNSFILWGGEEKNYSNIFDYALTHSSEMGFMPDGGVDLAPETPPSRRIKGQGECYVMDPFNPENAREQDAHNFERMRKFGEFPGIKIVFVNTEREDFVRMFDTPRALELMKDKIGFTVEDMPNPYEPEFVAPGIIADNDKNLLLARYRWQWGDGMTIVNARAARMIKKFRSDILVVTDPFRYAAVYDRFPELDIVSSWTEAAPDPKKALYIETLIAAAKPANQKVMHTTTWLNYPGTIGISDEKSAKPWIMASPDIAVESAWINLSRRPDALSVFNGGMDPFNGNISLWQRSLETYSAFKEFTETVVEPYGPMISGLERTPRKTAVLSSFASQSYYGAPGYGQQGSSYYANHWIYDFYSVMNMTHVPADVIFDETIERYGLDNYDTLVLANCDTLTESIYKKILAFQERGGLVIADQYLRADIPDVIRFNFDFTYRGKVSADAIAQGQTDVLPSDNPEEREVAGKEKATGVTAQEDQRRMESYAAEFLRRTKDNIHRPVECSTPTALLNLLEKDSVKYLFVINDKRTYGERLGKWKAILEKVVPQTVTITLNEWEYPELYVYDFLERKMLESKKVSGRYQFDVDLPAPGGKIIALYPEKFANVEIFVPKEMKKGIQYKIGINIVSSQGTLLPGVQPLQVEIKDPMGNISEFSDYYACKNGFLSINFIPGLNDISGEWTIKVTDLTAGITIRNCFKVV